MKQGKVNQAEPELKLKGQVKEYLEGLGYQVTEMAKLRGKSGVEHIFDMLAQRDDGFVSYEMAINLIKDDDKEAELTTAFNLANKAYDTGIRDKALIAPLGLS
jgi:general secretion pathway protein E